MYSNNQQVDWPAGRRTVGTSQRWTATRVIVLLLGSLSLLACRATDGIPQPSRPVVATILAGGDINVGRNVARIHDAKGFDHMFGEVLPLFDKADLIFANLECVLTDATRRRGKGSSKKSWHIRAEPARVELLKKLKIDVLNLANNHTYDYLCPGIAETRQTLEQAGLRFGGAGKNSRQAAEPLITELKGLRIGFLFYDTTSRGSASRRKRCGTNHLSLYKDNLPKSVERLKRDVARLRQQKVDLVFMSIHWGIPFKRGETYPEMIEFGHQAIDAGVDLILGHGNHELIGMESYKGKVILYDMGNFFFDMDNVPQVNRQGFFKLGISQQGVEQVEFIPYFLQRKEMKASLPSPEDEQATLDRMAQSTAGFGSRTHRENGRLYLIIDREGEKSAGCN